MASAFTIPPIFGKFLHENTKLEEGTAMKVAQLTSPVLVQLVATPMHLLGLDLYNRTNVTMT